MTGSNAAGSLTRDPVDAIVVGSYFYDAIAATRALLQAGCGPLLFYDIDTPVTLSCLRSKGGNEYIEADLILFHPYDRWGYATMPAEADDRYLRYVIARLCAGGFGLRHAVDPADAHTAVNALVVTLFVAGLLIRTRRRSPKESR